MIVNHLSTIEHLNWPRPEIIQNPKTLILGSFNPFYPGLIGNPTDYYYGRNTNYLWKGIAFNLDLPLNYFFINSEGLSPLEKKIKCMQKYKFCFLDLVDKIKYHCENENILNQYLIEKVYAGFGDNELFKPDTLIFQQTQIIKNLIFNQEILNTINKTNKIIHTLGNNTISPNFEISHNGSQNFIDTILNEAHNRDVEFLPLSYSPSQNVVNRKGQVYRNTLFLWIRENILNL